MAIKPTFEEADKNLGKSLSFWNLFFLSMGGIIGSGWLLAALSADSVAGPSVVISWIIGGVLVLFIALNYAEVSGMLPRSGAIVRYPHLTHGGYLGFILGWAYLLTGVTVPAIEAEAVVSYASTYLKGLDLVTTKAGVAILTWPNGILMAIVLMIFFFGLNYLGIYFLGKFNNIITWWKFIIPILTFILLFALSFHGSNFTAFGGFAPLGIKPIFSAIATTGIIFSYLGFRQALDYGGEAKNPQKDVPRATIASVVTGIILYALLQVSFTGGIVWSKLGIKPGDWASLVNNTTLAAAPFYHIMKAAQVPLLVAFAVLLLIDGAISPTGTGYIYLGSGTRTFYGMSIDGYLPKLFQKMNKFNIPIASLIGTLIIGCIFFLPLPSWYQLVGFISSATVLTYTMGGVSLSVMRKTAPGLNRPFRLSAAGILAPVGFLSASLVVYWSGYSVLVNVIAAVFVSLPLFTWIFAVQRNWMKPAVAYPLGLVFLIAWIATQVNGRWVLAASTLPLKDHPAFLLYFAEMLVELVVFSLVVWASSGPEGKQAVNRSWWLIFFSMGTLFLSYYGGFGPLKTPVIAFPLDTVLAIVIGLISYYWGVASGYVTPEMQQILDGEAPGQVGTEQPVVTGL